MKKTCFTILTVTALILAANVLTAAETISPLNEKTKLELIAPMQPAAKEAVVAGFIDLGQKIDGEFELSFKLIFKKIKNYADLQVCLLDKETGSELTFSFRRSDLEILKKYNADIKGVRFIVSYLNSNKLKSTEVIPISLDADKEYCFNFICVKNKQPEVKISELKNNQMQPIYQNPFEAYGKIMFDRILIKLRPDSCNKVKCMPSGQLLITNKAADLEIFDLQIKINSGSNNE